MCLPAELCKMQRKKRETDGFSKSTWMTPPGSHPTSGFGTRHGQPSFFRHKKRRIVQNDAAKTKVSSVDIPTGWDPRTKQQRRVALADFSAAPWRGFEKSERGPNSSSLFQPLAAVVAVALGWLLALPAAGPRCSNPSRSQSQRVTYAHGRGTISVSKTMQRANKDALEKLDPNQVYHTFPDRREGSKSSLILKKPKTKKSNRVLYMTKPLKEELLAWLEKLKQDEQNASEKYSNCGQLFRLPDGLPIAPELLTKWYRLWRAEHPEFEQIVFHGLRHSSATYQLLQSDGDFKSVQGNTGHATASVLMDTYAHTQDKPRLELTEKIEANFYSQDLTPAAPQPRQNEKPAATKISGKEILEAIRLMDADERRELTRALFA